MSETRMASTSTPGQGGRCLLKELITDDEFECYVPGVSGIKGELWFVRLCPPADPAAYYVASRRPTS